FTYLARNLCPFSIPSKLKHQPTSSAVVSVKKFPQPNSPRTMMKKIVVKVNIDKEKVKRKAMGAVADLTGIDHIGIDMAEQTMTVIGYVEPSDVVSKLNKYCSNQILTVEWWNGEETSGSMPQSSQSQTVVVENPRSVNETGRLVSNVVVGVTKAKKK
ncbi:Heavy metal-associated isoprenylated plant protein 39, partial [Linum perenne]